MKNLAFLTALVLTALLSMQNLQYADAQSFYIGGFTSLPAPAGGDTSTWILGSKLDGSGEPHPGASSASPLILKSYDSDKIIQNYAVSFKSNLQALGIQVGPKKVINITVSNLEILEPQKFSDLSGSITHGGRVVLAALIGDITGSVETNANNGITVSPCTGTPTNPTLVTICKFVNQTNLGATISQTADDQQTVLAKNVVFATHSAQFSGPIRAVKQIVVKGAFAPQLSNQGYTVTIRPAPLSDYASPSDLVQVSRHVCVEITVTNSLDTGKSVYCPNGNMLFGTDIADYNGDSVATENDRVDRPILQSVTGDDNLTIISFTVRDGAKFSFGPVDSTGFHAFTSSPNVNLVLTERVY